MSDITLKIDADTARFIAKLADLGEKTKKTKDEAAGFGKHLAEAGKGLDSATGGMSRLLTTAGAVGAAVAVVSSGFDAWQEKLREAAATAEKVRASIGAGAPGRSPTAITNELTKLGTKFTPERLAELYGQYMGAAPGSNREQGKDAVREADMAEFAGIDAKRFVGARARLKEFGSDAGDLAARVFQTGGDNSEQIIGLLEQLAAARGTGEAAEALPLFLGAGNMEGGLPAVQQAMGRYLSTNLQGGIQSQLKGGAGRYLLPDLAQQRQLERLASISDEPIKYRGTLSEMKQQLTGDPMVDEEEKAKGAQANSQAENYEQYGKEGLRAKRAAIMNRSSVWGRALMNTWGIGHTIGNMADWTMTKRLEAKEEGTGIAKWLDPVTDNPGGSKIPAEFLRFLQGIETNTRQRPQVGGLASQGEER